MSYNFNIGNVLVPRCIDDSHFSVVLTGVLTAIPDINKVGVRIVNDAVGAWFELDGLEKIERVAPKNPKHRVVPACHKQFVELRDIQHTLRLLESGNAANPLPSL